MDNISKLIYMGIGIILFCIGAFLLIDGSKNYIQTVANVREDIKDDDILYQQYLIDEDVVTYVELIGMLLQQINYDIEIDGLFIAKNTHTVDKIKIYGIEEFNYKKEYLYDNGGNVYKIVFTRII